jgi:phosphotransferase system HPr (HPr) family protein
MSAQQEIIVTNASGLHARPAARFVKVARKFEATLSIEKDGRRGNGKSLMSVLKLGITKDSRIVVEAEGPDEELALQELTQLLATLADED